jgi:hypothetical protein
MKKGKKETEISGGKQASHIIEHMGYKLTFLKAACFNVNGDMKLNHADIGNGLSGMMEDLENDLSSLRELVCPDA